VTRTRRPLLVASLLTLAFCGTPAAGQDAASRTFRDCPHCPEMVPVAPSSFVMGAPHARRVTIAYRFAYGRDKVSVRDWKHCVLASVCRSLGAGGTASLDPVVLVSWVDVQQYMLWLSLETGAEYRLLSEAEWEYLARAPATTAPGLRGDGLEWTSDCWHDGDAGAPIDGSSWDAGGDCRHHVARGRRPGEAAPVTRRYRFLFSATDAALGFRVARTLRE
jgi:formylglycine-generating enzyme required for sulfatase activity